MLNTSWDDDGEGLFNETWYGVLFGAAAGWQAGESSIADFQASFGRVFHGDTTGMIDQAQGKLMEAHALLAGAGLGDADDRLFWLDPWSDAGRGITEAILPIVSQLRLKAESALVLVAKARTQPLAETDALDALELGARRIELIGTKYQFAEEIARMYAEARDSVGTNRAGELLLEISQANGRMQDIRDAFTIDARALPGGVAARESTILDRERAGPLRHRDPALDRPRRCGVGGAEGHAAKQVAAGLQGDRDSVPGGAMRAAHAGSGSRAVGGPEGP